MTRIDHNMVRPWGGAGFVIVLLTITVGIIYIVLQLLNEPLKDGWFVGILMANTYVIYRLAMLLRAHLNESAGRYGLSQRDVSIEFSDHKIICDIFSPVKALIAGLLFGGIFLLGTLSESPWNVDGNLYDLRNLNIWLAVFLMVANVVTGMALYSLFKYFRFSLRIGASIEVDLWDRSDPAISALVETNGRVVLATAFVAFAGMVSIFFSEFEIGYWIILFSVFSVSVILLAYVVPLIPITTQIRQKKKENMDEIGRLIEMEYQRILDLGRQEKSDIDISRFECLFALNKSIKSVKAFPPVGEQSIHTAIWVTFLTMLPSLIEYFKSFLPEG